MSEIPKMSLYMQLLFLRGDHMKISYKQRNVNKIEINVHFRLRLKAFVQR